MLDFPYDASSSRKYKKNKENIAIVHLFAHDVPALNAVWTVRE